MAMLDSNTPLVAEDAVREQLARDLGATRYQRDQERQRANNATEALLSLAHATRRLLDVVEHHRDDEGEALRFDAAANGMDLWDHLHRTLTTAEAEASASRRAARS